MNSIAFQTKLESDTLHLDNVENFIGKDVIVTIAEVPVDDEKPKKKIWNYAGSVNLNGILDNINIRDFANE